MVGGRVRRGFRRLGLIVAVPVLIIALGASVLGAIGLATAPEALPYAPFPDECARPPQVSPENAFRDFVSPTQAEYERCLALYRQQQDRHDQWWANVRARQLPGDQL